MTKFYVQQNGTLPPHYAIHPVGGLHFASAERVRAKLIALKNRKTLNSPTTTLETLTVFPDRDDVNIASQNNNDLGNSIGMVDTDATVTNEIPVTDINSEENRNTGENYTIDTVTTVSRNIELPNGIAGSIRTNSIVAGTPSVRIILNRDIEVKRGSIVLVIYCDALYRMDYTFLEVCSNIKRKID